MWILGFKGINTCETRKTGETRQTIERVSLCIPSADTRDV